MINDYKSSTRYRRREETKNVLDFIHGGAEPSLYGAWDYLVANASDEIMSKLMSNYKRGRFLQGIFGKAISDYQKSEEAIKQSVALKYQSFFYLEESVILYVIPKIHFLMQRKRSGCHAT